MANIDGIKINEVEKGNRVREEITEIRGKFWLNRNH